MILCDHEIEKAVREGRILIDPPLDVASLSSSSLDLHVGDDFRIWKETLRARATKHLIDLDHIEMLDLMDFTDPMSTNEAGVVVIPPNALIVVRTLEHIKLPPHGKLAARVEGRSKQARLGLTVHNTAPTIHAGFEGKIALEIFNHGPFHLEVRPNKSKLCQIIFEKVSAVPHRGGSQTFSGQTTPLGTPRQ
jgi:dCTP deaminase